LLGIASRAEPADQASCALVDEAELTFAGFAVFLDPPKASAGVALAALAAAGAAVKVLTGDNQQVARHLCGELGFDPGKVLTGTDLTALSDEALIGRLNDVRLLCRVTPQQKLRVIMALKRMGQTVGFLGDGINDAPALHAADVGISVDSAADVAKAAAEVILLDQDLGVVHEGVMEGRRTVVNTGKYILMASSANLGNIFVIAHPAPGSSSVGRLADRTNRTVSSTEARLAFAVLTTGNCSPRPGQQFGGSFG